MTYFGDCGYFVWYGEPFEGKAKMSLLGCIRKSHMIVEKEKNKREQKIEGVKDEFELKIKKLRLDFMYFLPSFDNQYFYVNNYDLFMVCWLFLLF
ncbi:hypothetical protein OROGR_018152 [Orobanche gracilis]